MNVKRTIFAFVAAPFAVPLAFLVPFEGFPKSLPVGDVFSAYLLYGIYAIPIAYLAECILGLPLWWILRRYRVNSLAAFVAAGATLGFLIYCGINVLTRSVPPVESHPTFWTSPYLFTCVVGGAMATFVFWGIAIRGGTRDETSPSTASL